ncbi:ATP-binding protein [Kitasatospora sp. NPDC052896]|uniref:ATP-binding protein n=1 Tax=Kitasatospora sp. NPDC052896 TaxID=3364061 RepID=UPI0037CBBE86
MTSTFAPPVAAEPDDLLAGLARIERRVRAAVEHRRATDPQPDDPLRGLHLSAEAAHHLIDKRSSSGADPGLPTPAEPAATAPDPRSPLHRLARDFALAPLDLELLLTALLPDADARFERLYGYLNDDLTRRRPTLDLACLLLGCDPLTGPVRGRLAPSAPLVAGGLLVVEEGDRPVLTRTLRVPDRITAHLLGDDAPDPALRGLLATPTHTPTATARSLAQAVESGVHLAYLREQPGGSAAATAATALELAQRPAVCLDLAALVARPHPEDLLPTAAREARLHGGGLVAGPVDALDGIDPAARARLLRELALLPVPVLLHGRTAWDPRWADDSPLLLAAPQLTVPERAALWHAALGEAPADPSLDAEVLLAPYVLTPDQIGRAARAAGRQALLDGGRPVAPGHLRAGVRAQNAAGLERLTRRIEPAVGWDDLVLPPAVAEQLGDLALRARHRDQVLGEWRMRPGGGRGRGVMALFAGDSGTGKTMSAEVIAADLGLDLYVVDLSTVVDKYVGETEKNLERIFTEAAGINGILLFDEADAVFGKRSEVKDAHDRYANMESAYLLQRMESFDGIAILTTNLRANLDEAFTRRLDLIVDFPMPDPEHRRALWDRCLGPAVPRAADLDLDFCARFDLAGGSIRACTVTAGYLAAAAGRPLGTGDLVAAVQREYRKLGRLVLPSEFGRWATTPG